MFTTTITAKFTIDLLEFTDKLIMQKYYYTDVSKIMCFNGYVLPVALKSSQKKIEKRDCKYNSLLLCCFFNNSGLQTAMVYATLYSRYNALCRAQVVHGEINRVFYNSGLTLMGRLTRCLPLKIISSYLTPE